MLIDLQPGRLIEPLTPRGWSRTEVISQVFSRAHRYYGIGIGAGDRVFLHYGNNMEFFADLLALWRLGAVAIPIDGRLTSFEVERLAQTVRPRYALADSSSNPGHIGSLATSGAEVIDTSERQSEDGTSGEIPHCHLELDQQALILFTSGSTGTPKGVVHTHRSLRARWLALHGALGTAAYRRALCLLPTHFGHGLICNSLFP